MDGALSYQLTPDRYGPNTVGTTTAATSTLLLNAVTTNFTLGASATTTKSWTHTTSFGTNRLLVLTADILQHIAGTGSISSATYAGMPLIKAASSLSGTMASELWYLVAPPSGTNTISVTVNGATDALKFGLSDYSGASQSGLDATSTAIGTTSSPTASVTTRLTGDLVVATLSRNSTTTATTNRTSLFNNVASTTLGAASYQVAGAAGSISDTYTGAATQNWSMAIAAFKPATTTPTVGTTTSTYYVHPDHLGGANALTDSAGLLNEALHYYPYGALRTDTLAGTYTGTKRKFIGEQYDGNTQLNYLNARYQDSARGQFLSEDPVFLGDPKSQILEDPQSLNSYSYAEDNPITKKDPTGKFTAFEIPIAIALLAVLITLQAILSNPAIQHASQQAASNAAQAVQSINIPAVHFGANVSGVQSNSFSTPSHILSNSAYPALPTPGELTGKTPQEIDEIMKKKGIPGNPSSNQQGTRYPVPDRPGDQVRIQNGNPNDPNPIKRGPYGRVSEKGTKSGPFPLAGNPTLDNPSINIDEEDSTPSVEGL